MGDRLLQFLQCRFLPCFLPSVRVSAAVVSIISNSWRSLLCKLLTLCTLPDCTTNIDQ